MIVLGLPCTRRGPRLRLGRLSERHSYARQLLMNTIPDRLPAVQSWSFVHAVQCNLPRTGAASYRKS